LKNKTPCAEWCGKVVQNAALDQILIIHFLGPLEIRKSHISQVFYLVEFALIGARKQRCRRERHSGCF
jgi:hypothetical protein